MGKHVPASLPAYQQLHTVGRWKAIHPSSCSNISSADVKIKIIQIYTKQKSCSLPNSRQTPLTSEPEHTCTLNFLYSHYSVSHLLLKSWSCGLGAVPKMHLTHCHSKPFTDRKVQIGDYLAADGHIFPSWYKTKSQNATLDETCLCIITECAVVSQFFLISS